MKAFLLRAMLVSTLLACVPAAQAGEGSSALWVMGYYPAWQHAMSIADIPFHAMTHVVHFALVPAHRKGTGSVAATVGQPGTLADPMQLQPESALFVAAAHAGGVKALLGIGGDAQVDAALGFRQAMQSPETLASLVHGIVSTMATGGYDGVDINWEGLQFPGDVQHFQTFIRQLRAALDRVDPPRHYLLTYPAGPVADAAYDTQYAQMLLPIQDAIDQINLQTYSMAGAYPGWVTWHNSPLYAGGCVFPGTTKPLPSVDGSVQAYLAAGIQRRKLGIGIQFAGIAWAGGQGTSTGGATRPCQSWDYSNDDQGMPIVTSVSAATVLTQYTAAKGYARHFDAATLTPWLSRQRPAAAEDRFVSFENARSIHAKADYVKAQELGGVIIFEVSGDYLPQKRGRDAQHPLMAAVHRYILH